MSIPPSALPVIVLLQMFCLKEDPRKMGRRDSVDHVGLNGGNSIRYGALADVRSLLLFGSGIMNEWAGR